VRETEVGVHGGVRVDLTRWIGGLQSVETSKANRGGFNIKVLKEGLELTYRRKL
jgi:hypothetical protein